jgi:hypothetical protein
MFECGDVLRTFACLREPTTAQSLSADQIDDHRLDYLDFEGPVSGGRGDVEQWDCGVFEVLKERPDQWLLELRGRRWNGRARFTAKGDQRWMVTFDEPESD